MIPVLGKLQKKVAKFINQAQDLQNKLNNLFTHCTQIEDEKMSLQNHNDTGQVEMATIWFIEITKNMKDLEG